VAIFAASRLCTTYSASSFEDEDDVLVMTKAVTVMRIMKNNDDGWEENEW
jgi:hypothetical protein